MRLQPSQPTRRWPTPNAPKKPVRTDGDLGPLHGVPVTIKDLASVKDMPFKRGSHINAGDVGTEDAPFVTRLRDAGAIVLGKTTTSEFGWKGVSHSPLTGITHNPWKQGYNAGASSAGAGAVRRRGLWPPASRLRRRRLDPHAVPLLRRLRHQAVLRPRPQCPRCQRRPDLHLGPMTRTVADAALMLQVMAGPHPHDYSLEAPPG